MKKTIIYGLCLVIALMGSSCSDDEDTSVDTAKLTGIWQLMAEYDSEDGGWYDREEDDGPDYMVIHEDHYGYRGLEGLESTDYRYADRFTYSCSGTRFSFYYDDEEEADARILVIEKLTDDELVWRMDCYDEEDGYHWVEKERYKRYSP